MATKTYSVLSSGFIKSYIVTMRPYLLFVSGITGIVGLSFAGELSFVKFSLLFLASFLSYGFGQALTDCFQIDTDTISSPYRPLTQGVVSKTQFLILSIVGLIFCITIFATYNIYNIILGAACGIGLVTYTYIKKKWWGGPFYNASIVTILFLMAYFSCRSFNIEKDSTLLLFVMLSVFFGYANFVLSGYFKDIEADRATGYNTFPVVFGLTKSSYLSDIFVILFVFSSITALFYSYQLNSYSFFAIIFIVVGIIQLLISQKKLHAVRKDELAYPAIELSVHGYIIILSGISISQKPDWVFFLILYYVSFLTVMKLRPIKNQI